MKTFVKLVIIAAAVFLLAGCETMSTIKTDYENIHQPREITKTTVNLQFASQSEVNSYCASLIGTKAVFANSPIGGYKACAFNKRERNSGEYSCTIMMVKNPSGFNDVQFMTLLGHEFLHCTGLEHE